METKHSITAADLQLGDYIIEQRATVHEIETREVHGTQRVVINGSGRFARVIDLDTGLQVFRK